MLYNRKIEGSSRSAGFFEAATWYPFFHEPGSFPPPVNERDLELAKLFAEEERLAAAIAENNEARPLGQPAEPKIVDRQTIEKIVTTARRIAREGFSLKMVSLDEILDIALAYCCPNPQAAEIFQSFTTDDFFQERRTKESSRRIIEYRNILLTAPNSWTASDSLVRLMSQLRDEGNSAWIARVAAVLAYYSV